MGIHHHRLDRLRRLGLEPAPACGEHPRGEVATDDCCAGVLAMDLKRAVEGPGAQVEDPGARGAIVRQERSDGASAPADVGAHAHQPIGEIVSWCNIGEHGLHAPTVIIDRLDLLPSLYGVVCHVSWASTLTVARLA